MRVPLAVVLLAMLNCTKSKDFPCADKPCLNGGECKNNYSMTGAYSCICSPEWTGINCEQDVDGCTGNPCKHRGVCVNKEGGFTCNCPHQWTGPTCQRPSQCGPQVYSGWPSTQPRTLSSPTFTPANFSNDILPYICDYNITNLDKDGKVQLIFDDFLMYGSNGIEIFDGDSPTPILDQCFAENKRPRAILSSSSYLHVVFNHRQSISFQFPVFRAHYQLLSSSSLAPTPRVNTLNFFDDRRSHFSTMLWHADSHDVLWLFVAPKKKRIYLSLNPIYKTKEINIILDIHDGITSSAPKLQKLHFLYLFPALQVTSTSNGLYVRCRTSQLQGQNITVAGVFIFYSEADTSDSCSDFWCANNRCISSKFECDGVDHCGDNSDEKPCLGLCPDNWCSNGGKCHQVTTGYPQCTCKAPFSGDRCQHEEVCPTDYCLNGGVCLGHTVSTRYCICQRPYSGLRCEQDNSGCPEHYCQNGGSCEGTHDRYHCRCPADFKGAYCEKKYTETYDESSFHNNLVYTLLTVIPAIILLLIVWVLCRTNHCRNVLYPRRSHEAFVQMHRPSISRSIYNDKPPSYNAVVRNQRRKLHRHHSHPGFSRTNTEEPPPSYESVIVALNRTHQSEPPPYIRVLSSHSQRRHRSLDSSHMVLEMQPVLERPQCPGVPGSERSSEQDRGSSDGQPLGNRDRGVESVEVHEQVLLLHVHVPDHEPSGHETSDSV